jgi:hypothetical protein
MKTKLNLLELEELILKEQGKLREIDSSHELLGILKLTPSKTIISGGFKGRYAETLLVDSYYLYLSDLNYAVLNL